MNANRVLVYLLVMAGAAWQARALDAEFYASDNFGPTPMEVQFWDESTGNPKFWRWDFGDGTASIEQDPAHTYGAPGCYDVTLTVRDVFGNEDRERKASFIIAIPSPGFTAAPSSGPAPLRVTFQNTTTPGSNTTYQWYFGDGGSSQERSPIHTYTRPGRYTVTLWAWECGGLGTFVQHEVHVRVGPIGTIRADLE